MDTAQQNTTAADGAGQASEQAKLNPLAFEWGGRTWETRILTVREWRQYLARVAELRKAEDLAAELDVLRGLLVCLLGEQQAADAEGWTYSDGLSLAGMAMSHSRLAEDQRPRAQGAAAAV